MSDVVIKVEGLSKQYRLGTVGTGTLAHDLNRWWCKLRGKPDPYLKVTQANDRAHKGDSEYVWALRDIDFEVKQGEVLGIIGRNGAGKSTLLKVLSRITAPTTGSVKVKGRIGSLLEVGTGFHPELTGRENIFLNGAILGMTKAEIRSKLDEIVDFSGCERYLDTPVKRYSSGMMVRLGFAVAAHLEPEILIVDEVLAVGDAEFQKKCLGKMKDVSEHGRTVLFVSHNMSAVTVLCHDGLWLDKGAVRMRGPVANVVDEYYAQRNDLHGPSRSCHGMFLHFVTLCNEHDAPTSTFCPGDTLRIHMDIGPTVELGCPRIGIGVDDRLGRRVFTLDTHFSGFSLPVTAQPTSVVCTVPRLALCPGRYALKICVRKSQENVDVSEGQFCFDIVHADVFGSGRLPRFSQGPMLVEPGWEVSLHTERSVANGPL